MIIKFAVSTFLPGLPPPLLLQVQLADRPSVLLKDLVIDQHRFWTHTKCGYLSHPWPRDHSQPLSMSIVPWVSLEAL